MSPMQYLIRWLQTVVLTALSVALLTAAASANCVAHQPPNMRFTPPAGLALQWKCLAAGPLYEHERRWSIVVFKVTNTGAARTAAIKAQVNYIDAFGGILLSLPIVENANLSTGDSDGAVFAFHPPFPPNSVDHAVFYVLAVKFADGHVWHNSEHPPKGGTAAGSQIALRRYPLHWDSYDIGSTIVPSPSPSPSPTPRY